MEDEFSNGFHAVMYCVSEILDKVDLKQDRITFNYSKLGKLIKRQRVKSKHTLGDKEIRYYGKKLVEIFKNWGTHGHEEWIVRQKNPSSVFTVVFIRKESLKGDEPK